MPREVRVERLRGWVMGVWVGMAALGGTAWGREPANAVGVGVGVPPFFVKGVTFFAFPHLFYERWLSSHWFMRIAVLAFPTCKCPDEGVRGDCYFLPIMMGYSFHAIGRLHVDAGVGLWAEYADGKFLVVNLDAIPPVLPSLGANLRVALDSRWHFLTGFYLPLPFWHFTLGWRF
jgi:hypothetical protein